MIAESQWLRGDAALRLNRGVESKPLLTAALDTVAKNQPGSGLHADILISRARLEGASAELQSALVDYLSAFQIYKRLGDARREAVTLQDIGLLYADAGDHERALNYYAESKATFSGPPTLDLSVTNNRAISLAELGRFREAEIGYQQALRIATKLDSTVLEAQILNNLTDVQIKSGRYPAARASLDQGLRIAYGSAATMLPGLLITKGELDFREHRLAAALQSIEMALKTRDPTSGSERDISAHRTAYRIYKDLGRYDKALSELETYQRIDGDHRKLMASANSSLMAARFDFDNQKARIALLQQGELRRDIALSRLRARQGQLIVIGLLILISGLIAFFIVYLRTLRRSRDQEREANLVLAETNVKLENALQAKTQFLATTSHEIRTPLNGILGMTEVILADQKTSGWVRQRVSLIHEAGESMRALVDDLLDMSKMDAAEIVIHREIVDLPTLLWEVHHFWLTHAESAGLTLSLDLANAPVMIMEDARRLRQIMSNLLSNAVKFTPTGSIFMTAETAASDEGERLVITVEDTGIGIAPESRDLIFDKFTQIDSSVSRKYSGTGLGLSIARSLARAMGGDITLESGAAGGSKFVVTLPLERVSLAGGAETGPGAAFPAPGEMRVLIVEPNPIRQSALRAAVERKVEAVAFQPTIRDAIAHVRTSVVHVVIASAPKGGWPAGDEGADDLEILAATCKSANVHLVVIVDEGSSTRDTGCGAYPVSRLERPVSAASLLQHIESLDDEARQFSALSA